MKRSICSLILSLVLVAANGCMTISGRGTAASGRRAFSSLQAAVVEASESAKGKVALIKLKGAELGDGRAMVFSGGQLRPAGKSGEKTVTGLILTADGYVVVAEFFKPSDVTRATAWVGDQEYRARIVKGDSQLGMTIIKVDADGPLNVLDIDNYEDLLVGDWCVSVQPSDENYDYEQFASVASCRGQTAGIYREFLLDNAGGIGRGSPVLGLSGKLIGVVQNGGRVLAMSDIHDDLLALLEESAGVKSADEEAKQKAWLGTMTSPINKEYSRKHDLNKSYIWVDYVIKGSPADLAGIMEGDLITRVNDRDMRLNGRRAVEFFNKALHPKVGQPFRITVLRGDDAMELNGTFTKRPEDDTLRAADLGVTVKSIKDGDVVGRNLFAGEGVLVTDIERGGAASVGSSMRNGLLSKGDIITALGGVPTPDLDSFSNALEKLRRDNPDILLVEYLRGRVTGFAALNLKIGGKGDKGGGQ